MKLRLAAIGLILVGVGSVALAVVGPTLRRIGQFQIHHFDGLHGNGQRHCGGHRHRCREHRLRAQVRGEPGHRQLGQYYFGHRRHDERHRLELQRRSLWPVKTVSATVGQRVTKGQVLATADDTAAQLQLASAQATLASAQSQLATRSGRSRLP